MNGKPKIVFKDDFLREFYCPWDAKTPKFEFFAMPQTTGYSVTETLGSEQRAIDNAYTATMQVSKCIEAHDIEMEMNFQKTIEEYKERVYESETEERSFLLGTVLHSP